MEKRMILAVTLSLAILLAFQFLFPTKKEPHGIIAPQTTAGQRFEPTLPEKGLLPGGTTEEKEPKQTTEISTDKFVLVFSDIGGALQQIALREYVENQKEHTLYETEQTEKQIFQIKSSLAPELNERKFSITKGPGFLEYRTEEPNRVRVTKRYSFRNAQDYIEAEVAIKNLTDQRVPFFYQIQGPACLEGAKNPEDKSFMEAEAIIDGKPWKKNSVKGQDERSGYISWAAVKNRYFTLLLKPFTPAEKATFYQFPDKELGTSLTTKMREIAPQEEIIDKYILYAGPLDEKRLAFVSEDMRVAVDYGMFGIFSKILLATLRFFYSIVRNWGVAIILLTIAVNVVMFPLTVKSLSSMQKMKKVQPHIQKLKELHKDDSKKMNKEMMELYKKHNVNPLGGCLPMLLQMPIFIALYQGLMKSIELKGAHFLWIKNLAKPEAVPLPFKLPLIGGTINILPLLMVGMMVVQQKLSPGMSNGAMTDEQAKQQKMMLIFMPLLFGFIFYNMPSGLVLYWLTNTVLMTAEQGLISKRMEKE